MIRTKMVSLRLEIPAVVLLKSLAKKYNCSQANIVKWALWIYNLYINGEDLSKFDLLETTTKNIISCKE